MVQRTSPEGKVGKPMKSRNIVIIAVLALVCALALSACASSKGEIELGDGKVSFEKTDLTVQLPANPTTGYEWLYFTEGTTLAPQGSEYEADKNGGAVGGGGTQTLKFTAIGEGESTVYFTYARSWEDVEPVYSYSVTVKTDKSGNITEVKGNTEAVAPTALP